ncbi:MAG TPA: alpha/beta fold hydrolase [Candidatus Angelobacter sp.]
MKRFLALMFFAAAAAFAQGPEHLQIAGREVAVWKPQGQSPAGGFPLVLFSHGLGGCNTQSMFLMEALAQNGYLVLAPNHKDATCAAGDDERGPGRPQQPLRDAAQWNDATYKDRAIDMQALLDAVLKEKTFAGVAVDGARIGIAGHSLGGYTALGLAGGWKSWKDSRIRAVLALSPFVSPFLSKGGLAQITAPVMYQGGTRDLGTTPAIKRKDGAYDKTHAPKYFVEFEAAGHFAWTNLNKLYQEVISDYSVAFFDRYLKAQGTPDHLRELMASPPKIVSQAKADAGK